MIGRMETKLSKVRRHAAAGEWLAALRIVAKFQDLGEHRVVITRAWAAQHNPDFYKELGYVPAQCLAAGIAAMKERYAL